RNPTASSTITPRSIQPGSPNAGNTVSATWTTSQAPTRYSPAIRTTLRRLSSASRPMAFPFPSGCPGLLAPVSRRKAPPRRMRALPPPACRAPRRTAAGCRIGATMGLDLVPTGTNPPDEINVIVEIPKDADPVKYEVDKATGAIFVDRILSTPMRYPCNYGYVPHTVCGDGDPADVLVILPLPLIPGSVIRCRPVGVLKMSDEAGTDEKLLA